MSTHRFSSSHQPSEPKSRNRYGLRNPRLRAAKRKAKPKKFSSRIKARRFRSVRFPPGLGDRNRPIYALYRQLGIPRNKAIALPVLQAAANARGLLGRHARYALNIATGMYRSRYRRSMEQMSLKEARRLSALLDRHGVSI